MAPCAVLASGGATNATEAVVDMAGRDTELDEEGWALFEEPKDFRPPTPPPTEVQHTCLDGDVITLRLVGSHPLWGHYLWNAAPTLSTYLEEHASLVREQRQMCIRDRARCCGRSAFDRRTQDGRVQRGGDGLPRPRSPAESGAQRRALWRPCGGLHMGRRWRAAPHTRARRL